MKRFTHILERPCSFQQFLFPVQDIAAHVCPPMVKANFDSGRTLIIDIYGHIHHVRKKQLIYFWYWEWNPGPIAC